MFKAWKRELIRKHFDGVKNEDDEKTIGPEPSEKLLNTLAAPSEFAQASSSGKDEESQIQFLCEDGWESERVEPKNCGLNVCSVILICRREFFYQEPLWGKRAGGGAMWKGVWDWLLARAKLRTLKWWGHSSVANQVDLMHSKHCLSQLCGGIM